MSEMVERVARAMFAASWMKDSDPDGDDQISTVGRKNWHLFEKPARAAIEALREPTQAMIRAGEDKTPECRCDVDRTFSAMIDAALRKETT